MMPAKTEKAARGMAPPAAFKNELTSDSSTSEAQRQRIIEMPRTGRQTTLDFRRAGVMQSQTRIHELRALGYDIPTVGRVTILDDQGVRHKGVAVYALLAEPVQEVAR
jgi:hypothetical protein